MAQQQDEVDVLEKWIEGEAEGVKDFWGYEWIRE